jgi:hypothetical protein
MKSQYQLSELKKLLRKLAITIEWKFDGTHLCVGEKTFRPLLTPDEIINLPKSQGLLLGVTTKEFRKSLQSKNINYVDTKGNVFLTLENTNLTIEERIKVPKKSKIAKMTPLRPTLIVSPNGLALVELLFRLNPEVIEQYPKVFQFCRDFDLYQPKVSKIMTALNVRNLLHLKKRLAELPIDWWLYAFDNPLTKRKMTSFFEHSSSYYSLDLDLRNISVHDILSRLREEYGSKISEGPTMVATQMGELIDKNLSIWISPESAAKVKRDLKLIAGKKEGEREWTIASPPYGLRKAEILTHAHNEKNQTNIIRAIWDLSFSEARLREIRENLLRRFLQ